MRLRERMMDVGNVVWVGGVTSLALVVAGLLWMTLGDDVGGGVGVCALGVAWFAILGTIVYGDAALHVASKTDKSSARVVELLESIDRRLADAEERKASTGSSPES